MNEEGENRRSSDRGKANNERPTVLLDVEPAHELVDLIRDEPGTADEDLLDEALAAVRQRHDHVPAEEQRRIADGEAVALEVAPDVPEVVSDLVEDDRVTKPKALHRFADRLAGKLKRASRLRRRR